MPFISSTGVQPSPKRSADWADTLQTLKYCSLHITEHCLTIAGLILAPEPTPEQLHSRVRWARLGKALGTVKRIF